MYLRDAVLDMTGGSEMRDDVVLQSPDDVRVRVPVVHTNTACSGAVTAFLLRRIAYHAGAYAPGIQEHLFHNLTTARAGAYLANVQGWMQGQREAFHNIGYRFYQRWCAEPTDKIASWVREGRGYRGAVLSTDYVRMHPNSQTPNVDHAVGIAMDRPANGKDLDLVMIDPWPGHGKPDTVALPDNLDAARRDKKFHALMFYWVGWS